MNINKKEIINKISGSDEFKHSSIYKNLLVYLFEETEKGNIPKESTIAIEFFHKNLSDENSKNPNLRVYIHNLRKKLDGYYRNAGIDDEVKILIPKGQYTIEFIKEKKVATNHSKFYALLVLVFILILLFTLPFKRLTGFSDYKHSATWSGLLESEYPVLIVIGDYYVFMDTSGTSPLLIRDFHINSEQEFETKYATESYMKYQETGHTFLTKSIPVSLSKLLPILIGNEIKYEIKLSSNLQWSDLKNNNIIYIGSFKTLNKLHDQLQRININYSVDENSLKIIDPEGVVTHTYSTSSTIHKGEMTDYGLVTKYKTSQNQLHYYFVSTHDIGLLSVMNNFTDIDSLDAFENEYIQESGSPFFQVIYEVKGYDKTEFDRKMVFFKQIFY